MILQRRRFLLGAGVLLTAPAIVRASSLAAVPAFAVVPLYVFTLERRGGIGNDLWWATGSTLAPDLATASRDLERWTPDPAVTCSRKWSVRAHGEAVMRRRPVVPAAEYRDVAEA